MVMSPQPQLQAAVRTQPFHSRPDRVMSVASSGPTPVGRRVGTFLDECRRITGAAPTATSMGLALLCLQPAATIGGQLASPVPNQAQAQRERACLPTVPSAEMRVHAGARGGASIYCAHP
jgi:hypothetical protein